MLLTVQTLEGPTTDAHYTRYHDTATKTDSDTELLPASNAFIHPGPPVFSLSILMLFPLPLAVIIPNAHTNKVLNSRGN